MKGTVLFIKSLAKTNQSKREVAQGKDIEEKWKRKKHKDFLDKLFLSFITSYYRTPAPISHSSGTHTELVTFTNQRQC